MSQTCSIKRGECCLFYLSNSFARHIGKIAEDIFSQSDIAPSYAYVIAEIYDNPGISLGDLSSRVNLTPSTLTRFIDKLIEKGYVTREHQGRMVKLFPTDKSKEKIEDFDKKLTQIYKRYTAVLGEDLAKSLSEKINYANKLFESEGE